MSEMLRLGEYGNFGSAAWLELCWADDNRETSDKRRMRIALRTATSVKQNDREYQSMPAFGSEWGRTAGRALQGLDGNGYNKV
jgi:hypothetical protein